MSKKPENRKAVGAKALSSAKVRFLKGSAQKTRLVANEIRGKRVDEARAFLRNCRRRIADDILKLLKSAQANLENHPEKAAMVDPDDLVVTRVLVDRGPMQKRIQPAPMGRAYRIQKRTCHVVLEIGTAGKQ